MKTLIDILILIVESLTMLFLVFVLLRFLMQLARADFYNPLSQATVRLTNPLLLPLRKVIPGIFGIDLASLFLAVMIQVLSGELIYLIASLGSFVNPIPLLVWGALGCMMMMTYIYIGCMLIVVVSSFVAPFSTQPFIVLAQQIMQPILRPIQKVIPPMGGLDFSVFFVGIVLIIAQKIIAALASSAGLVPMLVIGL